MTCNCRADIEAKLLERIKAAKPDGKEHSAHLQGYAYGVSGASMVERPYMPFETQVIVPTKKPGGAKLVKAKGNMHFSYCPFCGTKLEATT